jgi:hypothetical protein
VRLAQARQGLSDLRQEICRLEAEFEARGECS